MRPGETIDCSGEFRLKVTLATVCAGVLFVGPFGINNLVAGRWIVGGLSLGVLATLVFAAWSIWRRKRWAPLAALPLAPMILAFLVFSIQRQGLIGLLWCYPAIFAFCAMLRLRSAVISTLLLLGVAGMLSGGVLEPDQRLRLVVTLAAVAVFTCLFVAVIERQQRDLAELARTDPLTRLLNRTVLDAELAAAAARSGRSGQALTLVALDVDWFKRINDQYGHATGDKVLHAVAECMRRNTREGDPVFRTGGEEFLILLNGCDLAGGRRCAEAVRACMRGNELFRQHPVTLSAGVAQWQVGESVATWLRRADERLYAAKHGGRDRVAA